jgi:outer membrane protein assembly factor BamB
MKKIVWKIDPGAESGAILAIPAIGNNSIVIGSEDKYLYCYNSVDGKMLWKYRTKGKITGSAVITSDKVLFSGMDGYVNILALLDGKKIWSYNVGTPVSSSPAVIIGKFFILADDGRLMAFGSK